jgi:hypothetical protein
MRPIPAPLIRLSYAELRPCGVPRKEPPEKNRQDRRGRQAGCSATAAVRHCHLIERMVLHLLALLKSAAGLHLKTQNG